MHFLLGGLGLGSSPRAVIEGQIGETLVFDDFQHCMFEMLHVQISTNFCTQWFKQPSMT